MPLLMAIYQVHVCASHPWVILGDFNEILSADEKEGGNPRPYQMMQAFQDCLADCDLDDMGFEGDRYTWRRGDIGERLDRAVSNTAWNLKFPLAALVHEEHVHWDHRPLVLDTEYHDQNHVRGQSGGKQFEARWLQEETAESIVTTTWNKAKLAGLGPTLADRTKAVHMDLHTWDREVLKSPKKAH